MGHLPISFFLVETGVFHRVLTIMCHMISVEVRLTGIQMLTKFSFLFPKDCPRVKMARIASRGNSCFKCIFIRCIMLMVTGIKFVF